MSVFLTERFIVLASFLSAWSFLSRLVIAKLLKYNLRSLPISHISYTTLSGNSSGIPFFLILKE